MCPVLEFAPDEPLFPELLQHSGLKKKMCHLKTTESTFNKSTHDGLLVIVGLRLALIWASPKNHLPLTIAR